jgi:hypothetical protein
MTFEENTKNVFNRICEIVERHGTAALQEKAIEAAAQAWIDAGFTDDEDVEDWLSARCFSAKGAQLLEARGLTPAQAAIRTRAGEADYEDTIGYKIIKGDLSFDEAQRIITSVFWNS